jgi:2-oxoglutarate ferredoxin oxidoreductase subunit alpha
MSDFGGVHRYNVTGLVHDMWGFPSNKPGVIHGLRHHLVDKIEGQVHEITRAKEYYLDDAECIMISYGSSARSALHVVQGQRKRGYRMGLLELQSLWPFPEELVRNRCEKAKYVIVVEMNMGQILQEVKKAVGDPERVFLANRVDGALTTPTDLRNILRLIQGRGV